MSNPISEFMTEREVGTVEMAGLLGVSKGYVSQLKDGEKPVTTRVARALSKLTGKPWWEYVPADAPEDEPGEIEVSQ